MASSGAATGDDHQLQINSTSLSTNVTPSITETIATSIGRETCTVSQGECV